MRANGNATLKINQSTLEYEVEFNDFNAKEKKIYRN